MAPDGRWCCRTIVGPSDVAMIMQMLDYDEQLRAVARRCSVLRWPYRLVVFARHGVTEARHCIGILEPIGRSYMVMHLF